MYPQTGLVGTLPQRSARTDWCFWWEFDAHNDRERQTACVAFAREGSWVCKSDRSDSQTTVDAKADRWMRDANKFGKYLRDGRRPSRGEEKY